ncbi:hypothetical protein SAMN04488118_10295 [Epibacterium ulvae]|uniref:Uncharacterized protein n=1 Tax=Epibacterium ulvae TaxID=1156985 RepID=A0A1G5PUQ8_9RHOB|nr:hypothetical protein SAMN04488118_10295 [Epibacterium ulvae]
MSHMKREGLPPVINFKEISSRWAKRHPSGGADGTATVYKNTHQLARVFVKIYCGSRLFGFQLILSFCLEVFCTVTFM